MVPFIDENHASTSSIGCDDAAKERSDSFLAPEFVLPFEEFTPEPSFRHISLAALASKNSLFGLEFERTLSWRKSNQLGLLLCQDWTSPIQHLLADSLEDRPTWDSFGYSQACSIAFGRVSAIVFILSNAPMSE